MKLTWKIRDLIDLEYFLRVDDESDDAAVVRRDRDIYLRHVLPALKKNGSAEITERKKIIRLWLEGRKRAVKEYPEDEAFLPGKLFSDIFTLLLVLFLAAGIIFGTVLSFELLEYKGIEPVNVSVYFGVFVLLQVGLVCGLVAFSLLRRRIRFLRRTSIIQPILGVLLAGIFRRVAGHAVKELSAERRNRLAAITGMMKGKKRIYGPVFYWPLFILAQIAGTGFNLGVLAGSILRIMSLDLAFGWQSTIQFSSKAVYMFVKAIALPWSWIVSPPVAHPTYDQIEGSRIVLKDGIYQLATQDLISWWPFLLLAVLCYGLLPRLILLGSGQIAQKKATDKVDFNHAACSRLLRRLNTPELETDGQFVVNEDGSILPIDESLVSVPTDTVRASSSWNDAIVLVPDDIFGLCTSEVLQVLLKTGLDMNLKQRIRISLDVEEDKMTLAGLNVSSSASETNPVVVLQEAWQPPISETLFYFRKMRALFGAETLIHILLIGKPDQKAFFKSVGTENWKIWKQSIQAMGDPFFEIHGLRNS